MSGIVRDQFGQAMKNVIVQAFDRDLRTEQSLGQKAVDQDGRYEISYTDNMFNAAEKGSADLVLVVVVKAGTVLFRSPVHYNAPADYEVNLSLEGAVYSGPAEWEVQTGGHHATARHSQADRPARGPAAPGRVVPRRRDRLYGA